MMSRKVLKTLKRTLPRKLVTTEEVLHATPLVLLQTNRYANKATLLANYPLSALKVLSIAF